MNNSNQTFNFYFKGCRNYVHGTDIVSALLKSYEGKCVENLDLKFHDMVSSNLTLLDGCSAENDTKVNIRVTLDGELQVMQLVENEEKIHGRYDYDEDKIIRKSQLDISKQQIQLTGATGYTLCENFVAMNKCLLQAIYPDIKGKWYFTRLEQKRLIDDGALIQVRLIKNFNFRLVKSDFLLGNEVIGSIYFTLVRAE